MRQVMNLRYETNHASVTNQKDLNSSFAEGRIKVMYTGPNRNRSSIDREVVEAALPTLYNIPIVAHYMPEENMIGGHDLAVERNGNDEVQLVPLTEPCGVVPEHAAFSFQEDVDENGILHEYLVIDGVLLWKRQPVFRHITEDLDGKVDHSMEIDVLDGAFDENAGLYRIRQFEFQALCLLERDCPCFEGSSLEVFSLQSFREKMSQMMQELKEAFSNSNTVTSRTEEDQYFSEEGGETVKESENIAEMDQTAQENPAEEFALNEEQEHVEFTEAQAQDDSQDEHIDEQDPTDREEHANDAAQQYALESHVREELCAVIGQEKIEMPWGMEPRYSVIDYDFDLKEVYVMDISDWLIYGFKFVMSGDRVLVDFDSKQRMKYTFVPYDNGEMTDEVGGTFSRIVAHYEQELDTLRQFRLQTEQKEADAARQNVLDRFHALDGTEAYEQLKADAGSYTPEQLEERCYAMVGRMAALKKFSVDQSTQNAAPKLPLDAGASAGEKEPYGGVFVRYGYKA